MYISTLFLNAKYGEKMLLPNQAWLFHLQIVSMENDEFK